MKVAIETYGCTTNQADSDIMRGLLSRYFELSGVEEADVVVVNSCGVVDITERKIIRRILDLKNSGKKVVLAGCLTRISDMAVKLSDSAISPDNIDRVVDAVFASLDGGCSFIDRRVVDKSRFCRVKKRKKENAIAIISISEGCTGACSFCATKFARGRLRSFSLDGIVEEVERIVKEGYREIQLTSQDTGAYGLDKGKFMLPELLERISSVKGDFRVRVGMMNPQHAVKILDDLINAFSSEKIYKFLHIPVQSGDNSVLQHMNRGHTVEDYVEVVEAFRKSFDDVLVSTDIIVGYPAETEDAFWKSYELLRETRPDIVNITRFSPRKGTPAAKCRDIPGWIKKERSRKLTELVREIGLENNRRFLGKRLKVLVTKKGKDNTVLARTNSYRAVITQGNVGEFRDVEITDCRFNYLKGRPAESKQ
ncbi:tRNA (N(6)-L-threonylcarbamoyladenosine(37)-C(2))-methylthiotransferase [Archaeoglobus neptunius]|uniref:tRNA (N(6)-L-threonylcarbamoyladenosine(37)-C(2))- methylthiotransferase n=1 Tax=Archaeoglobus neptunius TaxID=2798580 RepID=UPI0019265AF5|nr:tRNA (N(6)-L-threonylcarbamoyladenosine(37)-C(2))-methylthiotransferase [Archaeoglobus neptunius]